MNLHLNQLICIYFIFLTKSQCDQCKVRELSVCTDDRWHNLSPLCLAKTVVHFKVVSHDPISLLLKNSTSPLYSFSWSNLGPLLYVLWVVLEGVLFSCIYIYINVCIYTIKVTTTILSLSFWIVKISNRISVLTFYIKETSVTTILGYINF